MCSVVGCDSFRRSARRFKLPVDPERRLEWVQFLATVNKQRFKESSWTDITICCEHFKSGCFVSRTGTVQLKPNAVPSLNVKIESDEPERNLASLKFEELVDNTHITSQRDQLKTCDGPPSSSKGLRLISLGSQVPGSVSCSVDTSDAIASVYSHMQPKDVNTDLIGKKATLLNMKGKYVVNEERLLQLFSCKCPSCGCKLEMDKVTHGLLITLNQQCHQCDYTYQWKSQVNASVSAAEDELLTGGTEVTLEAVPTDDTHSSITEAPEIVAVIDEDSDSMNEMGKSSDAGDVDSDEDWKSVNDFLQSKTLCKKPVGDSEDSLSDVLLQKPDEESEDSLSDSLEEEPDEESEDETQSRHSQLCTDCGMFFTQRWPHTCEHKVKPYPCNICGKRCVSEVALIYHNRIHDENYEHRCKYCNVTFRTKVDKTTHQQIHLTQGKPYKCPDCSETFASHKERKIHLEDHTGPKQLKCHICGIEFLWPINLQRHLAVHTGSKPFKCSVCQRGFNQAGHLKSHMRLHTGERPYKCQHCDKCFNHNVSLKSHVQRYHTSTSGPEQRKEKINERKSDTGDAQANENKRAADSGPDNVEEEPETDEEVQKNSTCRTKFKRRSTGRPIGRPKNFGSGNLDQASNTKRRKLQKSQRTQCSDEESEDEPTEKETSFDSTEDEEERSGRSLKNTAKSKRPKNFDSDSDFDPAERKKKKCSSQNSGKSLVRRKGKLRKSLEV